MARLRQRWLKLLDGSTGVSDNHVLLIPMESNVIALPHQIHALPRAIPGDRVRYLLADEIGLGKTIEAGLVCASSSPVGCIPCTVHLPVTYSPNLLSSTLAMVSPPQFSE